MHVIAPFTTALILHSPVLSAKAADAAEKDASLIESNLKILERDKEEKEVVDTTTPMATVTEGKAEAKIDNYFAARITQGGTLDADTTFWDLGVNGSTQVVGVADTGLDEYSCHFYDSENGPVERTSAYGESKVDLSLVRKDSILIRRIESKREKQNRNSVNSKSQLSFSRKIQ